MTWLWTMKMSGNTRVASVTGTPEEMIVAEFAWGEKDRRTEI